MDISRSFVDSETLADVQVVSQLWWRDCDSSWRHYHADLDEKGADEDSLT